MQSIPGRVNIKRKIQARQYYCSKGKRSSIAASQNAAERPCFLVAAVRMESWGKNVCLMQLRQSQTSKMNVEVACHYYLRWIGKCSDHKHRIDQWVSKIWSVLLFVYDKKILNKLRDDWVSTHLKLRNSFSTKPKVSCPFESTCRVKACLWAKKKSCTPPRKPLSNIRCHYKRLLNHVSHGG